MPTLTTLPTEMVLLGWTAILLLIQIILQSTSGVQELGLTYAMGPQDEEREPKGILARRLKRALKNLLETFPAFAALALALAATGRTGGAGALGAHLYFWSRVAYLPLYAAGVPVARTLAFFAGYIGLLMMAYRLLAG